MVRKPRWMLNVPLDKRNRCFVMVVTKELKGATTVTYIGWTKRLAIAAAPFMLKR